MELLEIIITSISLFTIGAVCISIFSYIIYKYRNRNRIKPYQVANPAPIIEEEIAPIVTPAIDARIEREEIYIPEKKYYREPELAFVQGANSNKKGYEKRRNVPKIQVMNFRNEEYAEPSNNLRPIGIYGDIYESYESRKYSNMHKLRVSSFR